MTAIESRFNNLAPPGWAAAAIDALSGGYVQVCDAGHGLHRTVLIHGLLDGPSLVPDWPPTIGQAIGLDMMVYDWRSYQDTHGYCTGDDDVSRSLEEHHSWEGYETAAAVAIMGRHGLDGGWVVDVGAHIGWYTLLAATAGYPTIAVEANPENLNVLGVNCALNDCAESVVGVRGWIDPNTRVVPAGADIRLLKIDIEGNESDGLRVFEPAFAAQEIDFVLVELTPAFNDRWIDSLRFLQRYGYTGRSIPAKRDGTDLDEYAADPVGVIGRRPLLDVSDGGQVNALFGRDGTW